MYLITIYLNLWNRQNPSPTIRSLPSAPDLMDLMISVISFSPGPGSGTHGYRGGGRVSVRSIKKRPLDWLHAFLLGQTKPNLSHLTFVFLPLCPPRTSLPFVIAPLFHPFLCFCFASVRCYCCCTPLSPALGLLTVVLGTLLLTPTYV
jgi:hypothetical protein